MSGIMGIFYRDGRLVDREDLRQMSSTLYQRGPDGEGIWCEGSVGFANRMLWTTPESQRETLPSVSESGKLAITADARIDNREELIHLLKFKSVPRSEISDSDLILAAYRKWEERCPEYLLGDFAFAIWDQKKHQLFCARDHSGVKPFYYYITGQIFVFASEIKAILCLAEIPARLNEDKVADHLLGRFEDNTRTFFQDILRLPPHHSLTVRGDKVSFSSYWTLDPTRELKLRSDEEYAEGFRELFIEAVDCRLRSAFPVGSHLSGGLDSSSITTVARNLYQRRGQGPLQTFSLVFEAGSKPDERPYIDAVLAGDGLEPHFIRGDRIGPLTDLDQMHRFLDEPISSGNLFLIWAVNKDAAKRQVRVLLDGYDGDTTVSHGTGYFYQLAFEGNWLKLAREAGSYAHHFGISPPHLIWFWVWGRGIYPRITQTSILEPARLLKRAVRRHKDKPAHPVTSRQKIISPEFLSRLEQSSNGRPEQSTPKTEREAHFRRLIWDLHVRVLEAQDRTAAAFSLEKRYPFWDKRLVEFCLALPPEQKLKNGWERMIMRKALGGILPEKVRWRRGKSDMSSNFDGRLRSFNRDQLAEVAFNKGSLLEKYVNRFVLENIYNRITTNTASGEDMLMFWKAVTLGLWLHQTGLTP
jgi:asparagine synthase (glutamine-hydrolysing)